MQIATSKVVFPNQYRTYNKHSLQHNYNPQNENNPPNQQTEIIYSKESENGCFYTNQTPRQNEHTIHVDKASHQPHRITTSKRKSVEFTPKIQVKYKLSHDDNRSEATVINRAGKSTWNTPTDGM